MQCPASCCGISGTSHVPAAQLPAAHTCQAAPTADATGGWSRVLSQASTLPLHPPLVFSLIPMGCHSPSWVNKPSSENRLPGRLRPGQCHSPSKGLPCRPQELAPGNGEHGQNWTVPAADLFPFLSINTDRRDGPTAQKQSTNA